MTSKNANSSRKGKQGSTPHRGSNPSPGRGNNRPNARTPNVAYDFDKKHYNNPPVRINLVFPKHEDLTKVFTRYTIPLNHFVLRLVCLSFGSPTMHVSGSAGAMHLGGPHLSFRYSPSLYSNCYRPVLGCVESYLQTTTLLLAGLAGFSVNRERTSPGLHCL